MASTVITVLKMILKRKAARTPWWSPLPKNCAPKIEAPARPPKTVRLNTNRSWLTIATPDIDSVPSRPTITLSSRLTKFVMPCWMTIGTRSTMRLR